MLEILGKLYREEEGQGLTEYGLILGLVAIAVIGLLVIMGGRLGSIFSSINSALDVS